MRVLDSTASNFPNFQTLPFSRNMWNIELVLKLKLLQEWLKLLWWAIMSFQNHKLYHFYTLLCPVDVIFCPSQMLLCDWSPQRVPNWAQLHLNGVPQIELRTQPELIMQLQLMSWSLLDSLTNVSSSAPLLDKRLIFDAHLVTHFVAAGIYSTVSLLFCAWLHFCFRYLNLWRTRQASSSQRCSVSDFDSYSGQMFVLMSTPH